MNFAKYIYCSIVIVFCLMPIFLQAQNVGNWEDNTSTSPTRVGVGTSTPESALHVKANTTLDLAKFEQARSNSRSGGIYIKGAINGSSTTAASYMDLANYWQNISQTYTMARIATSIDGPYNKKSKLQFSVNNGTDLVEAMRINNEGNVSIGTDTVPTGYKMAIHGKVIVEELKVRPYTAWPDYVFASNYQLKPLEEVAAYIQAEKHLPGIPSAQEITEDGGFEVGQMTQTLLEKVEELTLYMIDLKGENEDLKKDVLNLKENNEDLMQKMKQLECR